MELCPWRDNGLVACQLRQQCKKQADEKMSADSMNVTSNQAGLQGDSLLATCVLDGVKATWIRDNGPARLMPRTLFPDASDELIKSLSLENGIPASISTFLVESDGVRILSIREWELPTVD